MSTPITRAMAKAQTPTPGEDNTTEETGLPAIDILSLCTQTEQHYRNERQSTKEKRLTRIHNAKNHIFKSSNYGIDGSFPPRVSSWSHRTRYSRGMRGGSRCRSEMSFTPDEATRFQSPKSGFSSPCFQGSSPPIRCRLQSYPPSVRSMSCCGGPDLQDFMVSRASLNKRPKKQHLSFKTDVQGNITNVSGRDSRMARVSRQYSNSKLSSFREESNSFDDSSSSQSKVPYFGRNVWLPDAEYDVSNVVIVPGEDFQASNMSNSDHSMNEKATPPLSTVVKKIDIKLPCLEN